MQFPGWERYCSGVPRVVTNTDDIFRAARDPREGEGVGVDEVFGSLFVSPPLSLPPASRLRRVEIHGLMGPVKAERSVNIFLVRKPRAPRKEWRRIAQLTALPDRESTFCIHTVPTGFAADQPFHLIAEYAYDRQWFAAKGRATQKVTTHFLAILYDLR